MGTCTTRHGRQNTVSKWETIPACLFAEIADYTCTTERITVLENVCLDWNRMSKSGNGWRDNIHIPYNCGLDLQASTLIHSLGSRLDRMHKTTMCIRKIGMRNDCLEPFLSVFGRSLTSCSVLHLYLDDAKEAVDIQCLYHLPNLVGLYMWYMSDSKGDCKISHVILPRLKIFVLQLVSRDMSKRKSKSNDALFKIEPPPSVSTTWTTSEACIIEQLETHRKTIELHSTRKDYRSPFAPPKCRLRLSAPNLQLFMSRFQLAGSSNFCSFNSIKVLCLGSHTASWLWENLINQAAQSLEVLHDTGLNMSDMVLLSKCHQLNTLSLQGFNHSYYGGPAPDACSFPALKKLTLHNMLVSTDFSNVVGKMLKLREMMIGPKVTFIKDLPAWKVIPISVDKVNGLPLQEWLAIEENNQQDSFNIWNSC